MSKSSTIYAVLMVHAVYLLGMLLVGALQTPEDLLIASIIFWGTTLIVNAIVED